MSPAGWRSAGLLPPLSFARHAQLNRAQETGKSQEINVFSLSFLLPVKQQEAFKATANPVKKSREN